MSSKPAVLALIVTPAVRSRLEISLRDVAEVIFIDSLPKGRTGQPGVGDLLIVELDTLAFDVELRHRFQRIGSELEPPTTLLYTSMRQAEIHRAIALSKVGASDVILHECDEIARVVRATLRSANIEKAVASAMDACPVTLPRLVWSALRHCFLQLSKRELPAVAGLAHDHGLTSRALRERFRRLTLPPPSEVLEWGRLFVVGHALDGRVSLLEAASEGQYFDDAALRHSLLRRGLPSPKTLRTRGPVLRELARQFTSRLRQVAEERAAGNATPPRGK